MSEKYSFVEAEKADYSIQKMCGWLQYYGRFYRSALYVLCKRINTYLVRWARKKYKRLHGFKKVHAWWRTVGEHYPRLFAQWAWTRGFLATGW